MDDRTRTFGDVKVVFSSAEYARDFDAWLDGKTTFRYGNEEWSVSNKDNFDAKKFFGIEEH